MPIDRPTLQLNREEDVLELRLPAVYTPGFRRKLENNGYFFEPNRRAYIAPVTPDAYKVATRLKPEVSAEDELELRTRFTDPEPAPHTAEEEVADNSASCPLNHHLVGCLARIIGKEGLGVGKLLSVTDAVATVGFFDVPGTDQKHTVHEAPLSELCSEELDRQQRVYISDFPSVGLWAIGHYLGPHGPSKYLIEMLDNSQEQIPRARVHVRWSKPIEDPSPLLAAQISETPFFNLHRSAFVHAFITQRARVVGLSGYLSSSVRLEAYQYAVVKQILQDPTQRYLLADEVGLGKTIEAGVVLRQYVLDHPSDHTALVVVPDTLVSQWKGELRSRFSLGRLLGKSVKVVSFTQVKALSSNLSTASIGLLIVDEAHHLTVTLRGGEVQPSPLYSRVRELSQCATRLLLLSATPVHSNEAGFLGLLHLLDPTVYRLDAVEEFHTRVKRRFEIADQYHNIGPEVPPGFLAMRASQVRALLPDDDRVGEITNAIEVDPYGEGVPILAQQLKEHLGETYRLHRRLLRNRRNSRCSDRLPGRSGLSKVCYHSEQEDLLFDGLENWRFGMLGEGNVEQFSKVYRCLLESWISGPETLQRMASCRLGEHPERANRPRGVVVDPALTELPVSVDERALLEAIVTNCSRNERCMARLDALEEAVLKLVEDYSSVVVFASAEDSQDVILEVLSQSLGAEVAVLTEPTGSGTEKLLSEFRYGRLSVLVCDARAEEGLNLYGKQVGIVHYDAPLNPNRIEQRLGRADRYGGGQKVPSVIAYDDNNWLMCNWVQILDEAFTVFDRSIASLQYCTEKWIEELWFATFESGPDALRECFDRLVGEKGEVEAEMRKIGIQDDLDEMHPAVDDINTEMSALTDIDSNIDTFRKDINGWCCGALNLGFEQEGVGVVKYRYQVPTARGNGGDNTLIPEGEFRERFASSINYRELIQERPVTMKMAFDRESAVKQGVPLVRFGNEFLAAMYALNQNDDRGRSFAFWRHRENESAESEPKAYFRVDFLVEGGLAATEKVAAACGVQFDTSTLGRSLDQFFPPLIETVWIDENRELVDPLPDWVTAPYDKDAPMFDTNISGPDWRSLDEWYTADYWASVVGAVRKKAEQELRTRTDLDNRIQAAVANAVDVYDTRIARIDARIIAGESYTTGACSEDREDEAILRDTILAGLKEPRISLDSMGAVIVANFSPFGGGR